MKFLISVSKCFYYLGDNHEVKSLKSLGFEFEECYALNKKRLYVPTNEKNSNIFVEINSLEDILNFQQKFGDIIIHDDNHIEIYNGYRE